MAKQDLKIQWEINFSFFLKYSSKRKKKNCNYIALFKKSAFKVNFGLREVVELKMMNRRRVGIFRSSTSRSPKLFPKADFLIKYYIITILNFFLERFNQYLKKSKNGFAFVFSNLARPMAGVILEIPYGCFRVLSLFLPNKHRQGGFFFRFEDGPSKLIP